MGIVVFWLGTWCLCCRNHGRAIPHSSLQGSQETEGALPIPARGCQRARRKSVATQRRRVTEEWCGERVVESVLRVKEDTGTGPVLEPMRNACPFGFVGWSTGT
jgi:hypothetical protein